MEQPKKKMIKVPKRLLSKEELESSKKSKTAGTPEMVKQFQDISDFNTKAVLNETKAKSDSLSTSKKFMLDNAGREDVDKVKAMAGRAGNEAANDTRKKLGNTQSKVTRFASVPSGGKVDNSSGSQDAYIRDKPVEKDFPKVKSNKK